MSSAPSGIHTCQECGATFGGKMSLVAHRRIHKKKQPPLTVADGAIPGAVANALGGNNAGGGSAPSGARRCMGCGKMFTSYLKPYITHVAKCKKYAAAMAAQQAQEDALKAERSKLPESLQPPAPAPAPAPTPALALAPASAPAPAPAPVPVVSPLHAPVASAASAAPAAARVTSQKPAGSKTSSHHVRFDMRQEQQPPSPPQPQPKPQPQPHKQPKSFQRFPSTRRPRLIGQAVVDSSYLFEPPNPRFLVPIPVLPTTTLVRAPFDKQRQSLMVTGSPMRLM